MRQTFFFYDLETSGLNPRYDRVMQFAGQRTDLEMNLIGDPVNFLVRLSDDILPSPEALMVTGITPQSVNADGVTEAEFAKKVSDEIFTPGTIAVGFNSIRFDDEFMRHTLWRSFYDPYEWTWADNRSRWDILDVVRLVRALRPNGIKWPVDKEGKAVNRLVSLTEANKLEHLHAHDALSDVEATIQVAKMLREKQPKIWQFLLDNRGKNEIAKIVNLDGPKPFVYASGRYNAEFEKTTVAFPIAPGRKPGSVLVYDLRVNPDEVEKLLVKKPKKADDAIDWRAIPVKEMAYNRCPAVAPLGVWDDDTAKRLKLSIGTIQENHAKLAKNQGLVDKLVEIWTERPDFPPAADVEGQLYDSFMPDGDKVRTRAVRACTPEELADFHPNFDDERLTELLFRYKARNFPTSLSEDEAKKWETFRREKFARELPGYFERLAQLAETTDDNDKQFILEEIQLFVESNMPADE